MARVEQRVGAREPRCIFTALTLDSVYHRSAYSMGKLDRLAVESALVVGWTNAGE